VLVTLLWFSILYLLLNLLISFSKTENLFFDVKMVLEQVSQTCSPHVSHKGILCDLQ